MRFYLATFFSLLVIISSNAQVTSSKAKKPLCNPLVMGQPATKFSTFQIESQFGSDLNSVINSNAFDPRTVAPMKGVFNLRANINKNVIVKPKAYLNIGLNYQFSKFGVDNPIRNNFQQLLFNNLFHNASITGNLFKPLSDKNFLLFNSSIDLSSNSEGLSALNAKNVFVSATAIYGWKNGFKSMFGLGITRTYRLGRVIHVPVVLWNKSFDKKWGVDMILPAKANIRYAPKAGSLVTLGFELEGVQYRIVNKNSTTAFNNTFLQRGEVRPKIGWDKKFNQTFMFSANFGYRIMQRFDLADGYDSKLNILNNKLQPTPFVNVGMHVIKFDKQKKKK